LQPPPVVEFERASQATRLKKLQCAIHGCEPDRRILCFDDRVQILAGDVPFGIQKHIEDQIALGRLLEPCALEMLPENLLLFAFHNGPAGIAKIIHARIELAKHRRVRGSGDRDSGFERSWRLREALYFNILLVCRRSSSQTTIELYRLPSPD